MPRLAAVGSATEAVTSGKSGLRRGLVESQILEASAVLIAERGFAATSLQDIADAVGVSRPALYHYVSSKDEILARLTDGLMTSAGAGIRVAMKEKLPADQQLALLVRALTLPIAESPGRFRLLLTRDYSVQPEARERLRELERTVARSLGSIIERGIDEGLFRRCDPRTATFAVLGMINWVAWWYTPGGKQTIEHLTDSLVDMALASLRTESSAKNGGSLDDTLASLRRDLDHLERIAKRP
jgi:AcrR family transcriptional regulator